MGTQLSFTEKKKSYLNRKKDKKNNYR